MPKISHPLSESERILFHANYKYMWDKISTTYFAVLRSKTPPSAKIDEKKLPSYAICAKCNNDESYAPSRATMRSNFFANSKSCVITITVLL